MDQDKLRAQLVEKMGIADVPQEKQDALITKMSEVLLKKIFLATIDRLESDDQETLAQMIEEKASQEEVDGFVQEKIPDYEEYIQSVVEEFFTQMREATV